MQDAKITLMVANDAGVITVYALNNKPLQDYEIQVLITEVVHI